MTINNKRNSNMGAGCYRESTVKVQKDVILKAIQE
jgi:hypothetical protein